MDNQNFMTPEDVRTVIAYLSGGLGDLRLVRVTCTRKGRSEDTHPGLRSALALSEVGNGIYWLAVQDSSTAETFLFMSLYAQKFAKLVRKWNKSDSTMAFDLEVKSISAEEAFNFYQSADVKAESLLQAVRQSINKRNR